MKTDLVVIALINLSYFIISSVFNQTDKAYEFSDFSKLKMCRSNKEERIEDILPIDSTCTFTL